MPTSAALPATPQLASNLDPNVTSTAPLSMHQGVQDLNNPIEMKSLWSELSAENCDPSDNPT
jgi:hypothetical protein